MSAATKNRSKTVREIEAERRGARPPRIVSVALDDLTRAICSETNAFSITVHELLENIAEDLAILQAAVHWDRHMEIDEIESAICRAEQRLRGAAAVLREIGHQTHDDDDEAAPVAAE